MKKQSKHRLKKDRGQFRTLRIIEQQKLKEQFFAELAGELENNFPKEHISFFIDANSKKNGNRTFKKFTDTNSRELSSAVTTRNLLGEEVCSPENELKKIDINIMKNRVSLDLECPTQHKYHLSELRKSLATPKNNGSNLMKISNKMFQVDCKMRKKYQRVKERILFNTTGNTFRNAKSVKHLPTYHLRQNKTQRACRFNTECSEDFHGSEDKIPTMLFGQLALRQRTSECLDSIKLYEKKREGDKRWLCFGGQSNNWVMKRCRNEPMI